MKLNSNIMRKEGNFRWAIISFLCAVLLLSCKKDSDTPNPDGGGNDNRGNAQIEIDKEQTTQNLFADDRSAGLSFTTKGAWTSAIREQGTANREAARTAEDTWLSISPDHGDSAGRYNISISLEPNTTNVERKAAIIIRSGGDSIIIDIIQKAVTNPAGGELGSGPTGTLSWRFTEDGTLTISGNGAMPDYNFSSRPWVAHSYAVKTIIIGNGVTSIGGYAFFECSNATSITIGAGVTSIGEYAFYSCRSLTSVSIPSSVTSIGGWAFYGCSSLTSVSIPSSVTSIGEGAFYQCSSLTSVSIPGSVTSIGMNAFRNCSSLTSVSIPSSVTSIGYDAFAGCSSLTSVSILATTPSLEVLFGFGHIGSNAILYVPAGSVSAYQQVLPNWQSYFSEIRGL
jgi:hypothetical protein